MSFYVNPFMTEADTTQKPNCEANQWTGFYMISASVMKGLSTGDSNQLEMGNSLIKVSLCEKFLGVKFDYKLTFTYTSKAYVKKQTQN